jgi:hypothetical protein
LDGYTPASEPVATVLAPTPIPQPIMTKSYPALDIPERQTNQLSRLFTQAELEMLPSSHPLDRKSLKKAAKKSAKVAREAEIREREADADMFDASAMFGSMSVAGPKRPERKKKPKTKVLQQNQTVRGTLPPVTMDAETQKELDFANFLNSVGGEMTRLVHLLDTRSPILFRRTAEEEDMDL